MTGVKYAGTFRDHSGYGMANRNFIAALFLAGVDVTTEEVVQVSERGSFGWTGQLAKSLEGREIDYKVKVIHLTPDMYPRYMEKDKYHIGHLFWETDKLPKTWVGPCNQIDELWTASESQAEMMRKSGVTTLIKVFPQPVDLLPADKKILPYAIIGFDGFLFYSIFQWIDRKNPEALIKNYWRAFTGREDVGLIIKTYRMNYSANEIELIKADIRKWKTDLGLPHYPKLFLMKKLISTNDLFRLHKTGGCYINASRGEGWCIPAIEAMSVGNPVIGIDKTGYADYMGEDNYYPCKTTSAQVEEVERIPWYTKDQNWLEIDGKDLVNQMVRVYNGQERAKETGKKAQQLVKDKFNYWAVGEAMKKRLIEIEKGLDAKKK